MGGLLHKIYKIRHYTTKIKGYKAEKDIKYQPYP